jgi:hypothetical protein
LCHLEDALQHLGEVSVLLLQIHDHVLDVLVTCQFSPHLVLHAAGICGYNTKRRGGERGTRKEYERYAEDT